jgi:hypothetical protein
LQIAAVVAAQLGAASTLWDRFRRPRIRRRGLFVRPNN